MAQQTKKPHFVPAAYLQFWDPNSQPKGRESTIWFCDGKISRLASVNSIAVQSGLYSTEDPDSAESFFQKFENDWARLVRQIENRFGRRQDVVASLLLVQSSNFLLRNPKFSRIGTDERIDIFKSVWNIYWKEVLMGGHIPEKIEDAAQQLLSTWTCYLLPAKEESWITSDNPVILLSYKNTTPAIVFLPITPTWALLALKKNVIKLISSTITEKDIEYLNSYTVINSIRHLYSNRAFDSVKIAGVAKWMERRPATDNWISKEQIHIEPFNYPVAGMTLGILKE